MRYRTDGKDIILWQEDFSLDDTLDCGQAFRWERLPREAGAAGTAYKGAYLDLPLVIEQTAPECFRLYDTDEKTFLDVWRAYFDLDTDYGEIKKRLSKDDTLRCACGYAGGIRLLKQDPWETLCSFIISQNNNIPRIKGIIGRLCNGFGGFPGYEQLAGQTEQSLGFLRAGFRAGYLIDAAQKLSSGQVSLDTAALADTETARRELMKIRGVGPKVADCVLLFGMHRTEAFPIDVWMKRAMSQWYENGLPDCCTGIEGIAQQYLFHYARTSEDGIKRRTAALQ